MRERKMRERKMTPDSETFFGSSYPGLAEPCSTSWRPPSPTIHTSPFRFARHHAPFTLPRPAPTAPTRAVQGERATRSGLDGVLPSSALASVATSGVPWFHSRPNDPSLRRTIPISTPLGLAVHGAKPSQSAPRRSSRTFQTEAPYALNIAHPSVHRFRLPSAGRALLGRFRPATRQTPRPEVVNGPTKAGSRELDPGSASPDATSQQGVAEGRTRRATKPITLPSLNRLFSSSSQSQEKRRGGSGGYRRVPGHAPRTIASPPTVPPRLSLRAG